MPNGPRRCAGLTTPTTEHASMNRTNSPFERWLTYYSIRKTPLMKPQTQAPVVAQSWLWPDHNIGLRESRRLREEHNALVNSHAALVSACESADKAMSGVHSWQDEQIARQLIKFALALAHGTKGQTL